MTFPVRPPLRLLLWTLAVSVAFWTGTATPLRSQQRPSGAEEFPAANSSGVRAYRDEDHVFLELAKESDQSEVAIPRLACPLHSIRWQGGAASEFQLHPEPDQWIVRWKKRPAGAHTLAIRLAAAPKLLSELEPITPMADGSIFLPAHLATTVGEKIRYEPQTFKNTVGYWVGKNDSAAWQFQIDQPGSFNVAVLQGCGKGQGGSQVLLQVTDRDRRAAAKVEFEVLETGHFQNFQWRHLGPMRLGAVGVYTLKVSPIAIKKNALMDVRAIHLIRLPADR